VTLTTQNAFSWFDFTSSVKLTASAQLNRHTSRGWNTSFESRLRTRPVKVMGPGETLPHVTFDAETPLAPRGWRLSPTSATNLLS
jgi:hypothetical protein